jgi:hypothetical protein
MRDEFSSLIITNELYLPEKALKLLMDGGKIKKEP